MADANVKIEVTDEERQITYTQFRIDELKVQRDKLNEDIAYNERVLAKLLESVVE
jgi:hypothetical protein